MKLASRNPRILLAYLQEFRTERGDAQAALPTEQVRKLMDIVGNVDRALRVIAWLVAVVAAVGILVGLYNTIQGRRREIAVLRALGARRRHVFSVILLEALLLCVLGGLLGLLMGHAAVAVAAPVLLESYGVLVRVAPGLQDVVVLAILLGLGVLAGLLPAARGLATPVAANLHPQD
ncbi:MAG: FtsX-like permease family protein [Planctomycetota bacterium]